MFNVHAGKNCFLRSHESILCLVQFLNNQAASCFIIGFYVIVLEMHLGFVLQFFLKKLLTMVGEIYQGEFLMYVSDRSILQKSKRLMTPLQFVIGPLISNILKSTSYPQQPKVCFSNFYIQQSSSVVIYGWNYSFY